MSLSNKELLDKHLEDIKTHFMKTMWEEQTDYERAEVKLIELIDLYASEKAKEKQTELRNHLDDGDLRFAIDETAKSLFQKEVYNELSIEQKVRAAELTIVLIDELRQSDKQDMFTRSEVESCIKDSLEAAAENAKFHLVNCHWPLGFRGKAYTSSESSISIDKSSITDTKNIKIK